MVDRQNRVGVKFGGGNVSSSAQTERERKERLRQLALESNIDLNKDPYLVRNHLGSYECKLCLTLHRDENNYLSHTQGKKHQQGLARRQYLDNLKQEKEALLNGTNSTTTQQQQQAQAAAAAAQQLQIQRQLKIGRPAYQVIKSRHPISNERCLTFEIYYINLDSNTIQPRHRFMSAYEHNAANSNNSQNQNNRQQGQCIPIVQKQKYQYLIIAAMPYETIAFQIPNEPINKKDDMFVTYWDIDTKTFTISLHFIG